jgi:hypothetical protein
MDYFWQLLDNSCSSVDGTTCSSHCSFGLSLFSFLVNTFGLGELGKIIGNIVKPAS